MPFYRHGTVTVANVWTDGRAGALWEVPEPKRNKVAAEYGRLMADAGFRVTDWFMQGSATGYVYSGHGLKVTVGTYESEGITMLDVEVEPKSAQ